MILEGLVTTLGSSGEVHIAPMGPEIDGDARTLVLKPFRTSQTYGNLKQCGEGIFHVTDNALLLAQAAIGRIHPIPALAPAQVVRGQYLTECCRCLEFRVRSYDDSQERSRLEAEVVHTHRFRDFFGFNRAKHAVVEAAILATRTHLLALDHISREYDRLEILVQKTGGAEETQAFLLLRQHLAAVQTAQAESHMSPT
jgi:uncharacterized protein